MHDLSRRGFLAGIAALSFSTDLPAEPSARPKTLVFVFLRGGIDGLSVVVPHAEPAYARARPGIAIPERAVIDLDGRFGLHPRLAPLRSLWDEKSLAVVQAVGSPHPTRSHFDAQDYMETGTPGRASTPDGWLGRTLAATGAGRSRNVLSAVALGKSAPRSLAGPVPSLSTRSLASFEVRGRRPVRERLERGFGALYASGSEPGTRAGREALAAVARVREIRQTRTSGSYPRAAGALADVAALIRADVGLEAAFVDVGGWDTHAGQGAAEGQLARKLEALGKGLLAFRRDLGDRFRDVVVVCASEFGRTVAQNGSGGTDHGHGGMMLVLGGPVRGGKVFGRWPGLEREQLYAGRDLEVTTDFRDVFAEVAVRHLGASPSGKLFPGYGVEPSRFLGMLT